MEDIWVWLVMQVVLVLSIYLVAKRAKTSGTQEVKKPKHGREECREMRELKQMRARSLSMPLSERRGLPKWMISSASGMGYGRYGPPFADRIPSMC